MAAMDTLIFPFRQSIETSTAHSIRGGKGLEHSACLFRNPNSVCGMSHVTGLLHQKWIVAVHNPQTELRRISCRKISFQQMHELAHDER